MKMIALVTLVMEKDLLMADITREILDERFFYQDGNFFWKKSPKYDIKAGDKVGHTREDGYTVTRIKGKSYLLHRLVFLYHHNYLPKLVDHIDNNPENNRIENLRDVSRKENVYNTDKLWSHNTSGVRGVSFCNKGNKWTARFKHQGKYLFLGYFKDKKDAINARQQAERRFLQ